MNSITFKRAWALLDKRERRNACFILAIIIVSSLCSAVMVGSIMPFLTVLTEPARIHTQPILSTLYQSLGFKSDFTFVVGLGLGALFVILLSTFIQILRVWALSRFTLMRMHTLSHRMLSLYLRQPYEFFLQNHSGALSTKVLSETQQVVTQFIRPAADVIASTLSVVAIVSLLVWIKPLTALAVFGVLGGVYALMFGISRRGLARFGKRRFECNKARFQIANEALGGAKYIKLIGRETFYVERYERPSQQMARSAAAVNLIAEIPAHAIQSIAFCGVIIFSLFLLDPLRLSSEGALGDILPLLGVFAFAGQRLMPELAKIYRGVAQLQYGSAAVDALYSDFEDKSGVKEPPKAIVPLRLSRELALRNVSYSYPNSREAGLMQISLTIHAGEKIGIVGSTGAGKTTFGDIILGLLRPQTGELVVDGTPILEENLRAWQQALGYVPQDIFLTDNTVAQNIAFGFPHPEIDMARVRRAAELAQIDVFVREQLSNGYETLVGERGVRLSGGQKQRLGIARALYLDADLILFDEATSALDNLTEQEVLAAINALPGDKTILMIAHRLSTLRACDRIIVLQSGRLSEIGTWDGLLGNNAIFQRIAGTMAAA